uniref:CPSF_A domain-containing protein n=1 Tax=Steinernema glaseri TaxID=37863 RepID=A0A1I7Y1U9_9BILA
MGITCVGYDWPFDAIKRSIRQDHAPCDRPPEYGSDERLVGHVVVVGDHLLRLLHSLGQPGLLPRLRGLRHHAAARRRPSAEAGADDPGRRPRQERRLRWSYAPGGRVSLPVGGGGRLRPAVRPVAELLPAVRAADEPGGVPGVARAVLRTTTLAQLRSVEEGQADVPALPDQRARVQVPAVVLREQEAAGGAAAADESDGSADQDLVPEPADEGEEGEAPDGGPGRALGPAAGQPAQEPRRQRRAHLGQRGAREDEERRRPAGAFGTPSPAVPVVRGGTRDALRLPVDAHAPGAAREPARLQPHIRLLVMSPQYLRPCVSCVVTVL